MEAEKIDIGWPDPGHVSGLFAASMAATVRDMEYHGCMGKIHRVQSSLLIAARNQIVEQFLAGDSEWLWFVDSDMVFDRGHPMKLWETASEHGVNMVSGLSFIFKNHQQPVPSIFYRREQDASTLGLITNEIPTEPIKVMATGLASSLIHREVFEAMQPPRNEKFRWFDLIPVMDKPGFAGEDVQFFIRAGELGYDLVLDPNAETWHIKWIGVGRQDFDRYWELRNREDVVAA